MMKKYIFSALLLILTAYHSSHQQPEALNSKVLLGEALFNDKNLSLNRTQSCATCHNGEHAFIDVRIDSNGDIPAVSVGDDGFSLGDRNAPTLNYALFSPDFHIGTRIRAGRNNVHRTYTGALGGQFFDGRAINLTEQAGIPPLNPVEMGIPDKASVVQRLLENNNYAIAFKLLYGNTIFDDIDAAYAAMVDSIGKFEQTEQFASFDSKFDRSLTGDYIFSFKELTGKSLFFRRFNNCNICHLLDENVATKFVEPFSSFEYHNIGIPVNTTVRLLNAVVEDNGLLSNPAITDEADKGKHKVPTLRNVAVTEPYMHNGIFRNLKTVVEFYDHFVNADVRLNNPETGMPWEPPENAETVNSSVLAAARTMTDDQIEAMICFLRTLTDQRYEHLIQEKGIICTD